MSEGSRISFRGSSAAEAEDFVQAVRRKGLAEQKQFDDRWMAAYAAAQMSGQALRWHMSLPMDIRSDWGKLEVAILDRFAPDQPSAPSNNPIVPSGAPAQPVICRGRIRITEYGTGKFVGYISKSTASPGNIAEATTRAEDSLLVEFRPSSSLVTFDLVDKSNFHRLALRLYNDKLELSTDRSSLQFFNLLSFAPGPKPGSIRYSSQPTMGHVAHVQHAVWQVDADGSITPVWPSSPQIEVGGFINLSPSIFSLYFVANITTVMNDNFNTKEYARTKLEFEHA